jgi:ferric-dicitrate binding protein FerR (iron transport regulator)
MILTGGSRALMTGDTQARLSRDGSSIDLELMRGKMEFTSSAKSQVEGSVGDVSFRPENPSQTAVAAMSLDGSNHTVLYADKGDWIVTTAHDGHSMILRSGTHIEGVLTAAQDQNDNTAPAQEKKKKKRKMAVIWIGTAIAGTATGLGMAFGMSECNVVSGPTCSESPTTPGN